MGESLTASDIELLGDFFYIAFRVIISCMRNQDKIYTNYPWLCKLSCFSFRFKTFWSSHRTTTAKGKWTLHFSLQSFASCCKAPKDALSYSAMYEPPVQGASRSALGTRWHFQPLPSAMVEEWHSSCEVFCLFKIISWHTLLPLLNKNDANPPIPHTCFNKVTRDGTNASVYLEQYRKSPICDFSQTLARVIMLFLGNLNGNFWLTCTR